MSDKRTPLLKAGRPGNSPQAKARAAAIMGNRLKPVRVNFDVDFALHNRLKVLAAHAGLPISALLRRAIERLVNGEDDS